MWKHILHQSVLILGNKSMGSRVLRFHCPLLTVSLRSHAVGSARTVVRLHTVGVSLPYTLFCHVRKLPCPCLAMPSYH
jgi:hypothetical protein